MGVLQGVALQQGAVGEGPVAHVALEGALGTVSAHVHVQRAFLGEALAAHGALEGPDAGVHHHVFEEVVTQGEGAPTDGALMRFLTWRGRQVQTHIPRAAVSVHRIFIFYLKGKELLFNV